MLYAGLDLSRQKLDVHVLDEAGRTVEVTAVYPDADALRTLARVVARDGQEVTAAIESMNSARFVHDTLELAGWDVEIADAAKVDHRWTRSAVTLRSLGAPSLPGAVPLSGGRLRFTSRSPAVVVSIRAAPSDA